MTAPTATTLNVLDFDCTICARAKTTGWWGQAGTHCHDCHRSWRSRTEAHCPVCCGHFSNYRASDLHRGPGGHCRAPGSVLSSAGEPVLKLTLRSSGPTWARADNPRMA